MDVKTALQNIETILDNQVTGLNGLQFKILYQSWNIILQECNNGNDK